MPRFMHEALCCGPGLRRILLLTSCNACSWFAAGTSDLAIEIAEHAHLCAVVPKKPPAKVASQYPAWNGARRIAP